jgi:hypothetical protein
VVERLLVLRAYFLLQVLSVFLGFKDRQGQWEVLAFKVRAVLTTVFIKMPRAVMLPAQRIQAANQEQQYTPSQEVLSQILFLAEMERNLEEEEAVVQIQEFPEDMAWW